MSNQVEITVKVDERSILRNICNRCHFSFRVMPDDGKHLCEVCRIIVEKAKGKSDEIPIARLADCNGKTYLLFNPLKDLEFFATGAYALDLEHGTIDSCWLASEDEKILERDYTNIRTIVAKAKRRVD